MRKAAVVVLIALAATACSQKAEQPAANSTTPAAAPSAAAAASPTATPTAAAVAINLAPEGLSLVDPATGNARTIAYGAPRATIEGAVTAALGEPTERGHSAECGAGAMDFTTYKGDLQLTFQEGKFIGWTINRGPAEGLATASGIGIGSTRAAVEKAYDITVEEGSLGILFSAGSLAGILDGTGKDAKVTDIWGGTVCLID